MNNEEFAYIKWFIPKNLIMKFIDAVSVSKNIQVDLVLL